MIQNQAGDARYKVLITSFLILLFSNIQGGELEHSEMKFWEGNTFHQNTIDMTRYPDHIIRAKVDGKWQEFRIRELPEEFIKWNLEKRLETLKFIREHKPPPLSGPHNAIVASYGIKRFDTEFKINNAVKGMGFVPKPEKIKEVIGLLKSTMDTIPSLKLKILEGFHKNTEMIDLTKQVSLELYSTPEFETHTFINQMVNPAVSIVFLDIPCFEIKAIAQLLHPEDEGLSDYERDVVEYVNLIHSYFHGKFKKNFITVIYHIIEVYNNTPGAKEGMGRRVIHER